MIVQLISLFFLSYLIGSIPFALILGKAFHNIDIRNFGSGNLGTTNTIRVLGKKTGGAVLILDVGKGFLAASLPTIFNMDINVFIVGIFAVIGHALPIFAKFKGGKSVAVTTGIILSASPLLFFTGFLTFVITIFTFRMVSLSSILTGVVTIILSIFYLEPLLSQITLISICLFVIFKHRTNIIRILNKTEPKVFNKKIKP